MMNRLYDREAVERLRAFWAGSSLGRPALGITFTDPQVSPDPWPGEILEEKERDLLPDWHAWSARNAVRQQRRCAEAMPGFHVAWGSFLVTLAVLAGEAWKSGWVRRKAGFFARKASICCSFSQGKMEQVA